MNYKQLYIEKLKDPRWQKKRLDIMERDGWACRSCGDNKKTLHVHHLAYIYGNDPWDYMDETLVTLCDDCHEYETRNLKGEERLLLIVLKMRGYYSSEMSKLSEAFYNSDMGVPAEVVADMLAWVLSSKTDSDEIKKMYFDHLRLKNSNKVSQ